MGAKIPPSIIYLMSTKIIKNSFVLLLFYMKIRSVQSQLTRKLTLNTQFFYPCQRPYRQILICTPCVQSLARDPYLKPGQKSEILRHNPQQGVKHEKCSKLADFTVPSGFGGNSICWAKSTFHYTPQSLSYGNPYRLFVFFIPVLK